MPLIKLLSLLGISALAALSADAAPGVSVVKTPTTKTRNPFYVSNKAPLTPNPLIKLPIGSIRPAGWLRTQLSLMSNGFTGRLPEVSGFTQFNGNAWVSPNGEGQNGWEEVPYWLKGYGDLGYVLKDQRIISDTKRWLDGVISSQEADGYFGPRSNKQKPDLWPNMPMLDALQSYYEYTGDKRVLTLMSRYFKYELDRPGDILPGYWDKMRGGDNLQSIYWLYNRTGEKWLLEAAQKVHACTAKWSDGVVNWHGVNITQGFREPAVYYQQSRNPAHYAAAERNYQDVISKYGQVPGGLFGSDENARPGYHDPRQGTETCSMVEFMHSDQMLLGISGDPLLADRCEEIAFNDLPAAMTPDLKGLHYLTAPNQPQLDRESKSPGIQNGGDMFSYNPRDFRCCQHNVAMGWPYYAEHLWMATQDRGLAAILYSAATVTAKVGPGKGTDVTITETTNYPFSEKVEFTLAAKQPVKFPLLLRVPQWCQGAAVSVNGKRQAVSASPLSYIVLDRTWKAGDKVALTLPMQIATKTWAQNGNSVSVRRGPLWYSLKIGEKWAKYGPQGDKWPGYEVFPTTPWNYGLDLDAQAPARFAVSRKSGPLPAQPFTPEAAPITLTAKGRIIPAWTMKHGLAETLKASPVRTETPVEEITLIPMGCARLRIAAFPTVGDGPDAKDWPQPVAGRHEASHEFDDINAPSDGIVPASSNDQSIPRFTWWDRRGTEEWITTTFPAARPVSGCSLYWFDDTGDGSCRVPASWTLLYKDGDAWKPVENASGYGTAKDTFNAVTFTPVTTTALKLVAQLQPQMSGGILEWQVR